MNNQCIHALMRSTHIEYPNKKMYNYKARGTDFKAKKYECIYEPGASKPQGRHNGFWMGEEGKGKDLESAFE